MIKDSDHISPLVEPQTTHHTRTSLSKIVHEPLPSEHLQTIEQRTDIEQKPTLTKTVKKVTKKIVRVAKNIGVRKHVDYNSNMKTQIR